jgi:hypothetical protein
MLLLLHPRSAPSHRLIELTTAPGFCSSSWSWSPWPSAVARPQLLGHDLDNGSGAAVLGGPGPLLELTALLHSL